MALPTKRSKATAAALKYGYRSGLEVRNADRLKSLKVPFDYEKYKIKWTENKVRTYTPDFVLPSGIIIETKGRFVAKDRQKHLDIKKQYPTLDIRFVFTNPNAKLSKASKTTYASWCDKHGFLYSKEEIPEEWTKETKDARYRNDFQKYLHYKP
mgnify:CR=1 FL=1|jgi:hypothetical protein